jgi:hypothetical protein
MKLMHRTAGYTILDKKRNEHILEELQAEPITTYLQQYRAKWESHNECTTDTRWPKLITSYKPPGKRSLGRLQKRWSETVMDHQNQKRERMMMMMTSKSMCVNFYCDNCKRCLKRNALQTMG